MSCFSCVYKSVIIYRHCGGCVESFSREILTSLQSRELSRTKSLNSIFLQWPVVKPLLSTFNFIATAIPWDPWSLPCASTIHGLFKDLGEDFKQIQIFELPPCDILFTSICFLPHLSVILSVIVTLSSDLSRQWTCSFTLDL